MQRRTWLAATGAATLAMAAGPIRAAAGYPERPIRLVVPFQAGSGPDTLARVVAEELGRKLGQTLVVDNAPGAGGVIGAMTLKRAAPDGYTLGLFANSHAINVHTFKNMPYDTAQDFTPIGALVTNSTVLAVPGNSPFRTVQDLVAALKRAPGTLNYASGGKGSISHLAVEMLLDLTDTQAVHVPYKGAVDIVTAMVGGQTQFGMPTLGVASTFLQRGQIRVLAVASSARSRLLPDIPSLAELIPPGVVVDNWSGLFGPARLPAAITQRIFQVIGEIQDTPAMANIYKATGADPLRSKSPQDFKRLVADDMERYGMLMHKLGITAV